ncbi:pyridoxamine 5'-phosphate oxidase [Escherichia coli]|uniref:Pyridoxamine 5'-phosphate oxidase n=1 Tax=Escherichia coli TaxID=562 RepID=A0A376S9I8_ECOLX|nr:pyridoxamine 5'-phosphate oxidase [Escherichia coli]
MSDNDELQQIAHLRREYTKGGLRRRDLPADPLTLFERWLSQACEAKLADPTAMVVATVDEHGQPYQRIVLLKHYDEKGMVFYTNLGSRKAHQIENNPRVSLLFPWHTLERQVMVIGKAERLSTLEVMKYFIVAPVIARLVHGFRSSPVAFLPAVSLKVIPGAEAEVQQAKCHCRVFGAVFASALNRLSSGRAVSIACMTAFCTSVKMMRGRLIVLPPEKMQKSCFNRWYS